MSKIISRKVQYTFGKVPIMSSFTMNFFHNPLYLFHVNGSFSDQGWTRSFLHPMDSLVQADEAVKHYQGINIISY